MLEALIVSAIFAAEIELKYPAEVTVRELLCFDATESKADHFAWQVHYTDTSKPPDGTVEIKRAVRLLVGEGYTVTAPEGAARQDYRIVEDGKLLFAPSVPGREYVIFLAASDADGIASAKALTTVKPFDGPRPPPPPPPPPPGDDDDPPPDVKLDYSADARQWYRTVPATARNKTAAVSKTLIEIGTRGREIGSIEAIDAVLSVGIGATLGTDGARDWALFLTEANAVLGRLSRQGVTPEQYGRAVASIGEGLK